jgi:hypothetical protein
MITRRLLSLIITLAAFACACSQPSPASSVTKPVVPKTEAACLAQGGSWTTLGLPSPNKPKICDLKTTDAGKACTDTTHCQGICLAPADAANGATAAGSCSPYVANFGNVSLVVDGKVEHRNVE